MLDEIIAATRKRLDRLDEAALRGAAREAPPIRDFAAALAAPALSVIAEVKRRSPSRGELAPTLDVAGRASAYEKGGAAALSVLTEPEFFSGSMDDLATARAATAIPVLRKDFIVAPAQVWEARAGGADAVLLIVAALQQSLLEQLLKEAAAAGLAALVEVHDEAEIERALAAGASLVGVNNRDLRTFEVDLDIATRLVPRLSEVDVRVAESGVSNPAAAARMARAGYDAILVGEALVRSPDPAELVATLRGAQ